MMAITIGGLVYSPLQDAITSIVGSKDSSAEVCASFVYLLASLSMAVPVICLTTTSSMPAHCQDMILGSFLVVEFCVGLFMPVAGTLRSRYVPDAQQGAILNIFRLPLNAIVVSGTYATDHLERSLCYKLVSGCFFGAALLQATMIAHVPRSTVTVKSAQKID
jgi:MFS family permease